jgi:DNA-binding CsgD family transcriptional regulator
MVSEGLGEASETAMEDVRGPVSLRVETAQTFLRPAGAAALAADYEAGALVKDLAEKYGVHRSTVRAHLARRGQGRPKAEVLGPEAAAAAVGRYAAGSTLVEVAAGLGVGPRAVRRALADAGVGVRKPGQRGDGLAARGGEVMAMRAEGWSLARIGKALGVAPSSVQRYVVANG